MASYTIRAGVFSLLIALGYAGQNAPAQSIAKLGLSALPRPFIIAHRGSPNLYPEHTLEAYRASLADGNWFVEADCYLLADGAVGIMHDETIDRTTTAKGRTETQTAASWGNLQVDGSRIIGGRFGKQKVPLLNDVLDEFAGRAILVLEAKNRGSGKAIVEALRNRQISKDQVLVNSFAPDELKPAIEAGYEACLNFAKEEGAPDPSTYAGKGIRYVSLHKSFSADYVQRAKKAHLVVLGYTVNRQNEKVALLAKGFDGLYSDDPVYVSGTGYQRREDPYAKRTWYHGQLVTLRGTRGGFYEPDKWGLSEAGSDSFSGVLQGWCSPLNKGNPYATLEINLIVTLGRTFTDNHGAVIILSTEDIDWDGQGRPVRPLRGYVFRISKSGALQIEHYDGGASELLAQYHGFPLRKDESINYRLSRSGGRWQLVNARTGEGVSCAASDLTPGYLTLGVRGAEAYFSRVTVNVR
jgi:glycerophosphoryl diester phosphodiesterase